MTIQPPLGRRGFLVGGAAAFPAVGSWECIITDHEVIGAESM